MKPRTGQCKPSPCDGCSDRNGHQGIVDGYQPVPRKGNGKNTGHFAKYGDILEKGEFSFDEIGR